MKGFIRIFFSKKIVQNAIKIAFVVGITLNIINQGKFLLEPRKISWLHFVLNFLVPYCVASFSATKNHLSKCSDTK